MKCNSNRGFTLIELLIVTAIIGLLIQLILPAVEMAREAARRTHCQSNLRQIALACQLHESTHRQLPTGGWGWFWTGDSKRGFGPEQPGGWIYNILPYIEQDALRRDASGGDPVSLESALQRLVATPISLLNCPSRRLPRAYPYHYHVQFLALGTPKTCARSDYAANLGSWGAPKSLRGPRSYEAADAWIDGEDAGNSWAAASRLNGVIFQRSAVKLQQITDGLSATALAGEKYLQRESYKTGKSLGDSEHLYMGYDNDVLRAVHARQPPRPDGDEDYIWRFGGAHPSAFNLAMCDGSVQPVDYDVDVVVYQALGDRGDEKNAKPSK